MRYYKAILLASISLSTAPYICADSNLIHYTGITLSDPYRHDGGLAPTVGVHNIQTMRANRRHDLYASNSTGWTYNHQPMLAWWNGRFYMHYLSNPADEHVGGGRTMIQSSADGYSWTAPQVLFPVCAVPDGFRKSDDGKPAKDLEAVMHQRMGFFVSASGRLLATGNYGIALHPKDDPNDGNGMGRVVREILPDGSFGPIYFIYRNHGFKSGETPFPDYTKSPDKGFRKACEELLANPLMRMQWVEEADRNDPLIPLKKPYKAFCWYTLPDGRKAGLWKHALTSVSDDGGETWAEPVQRAKGFVNSNAKIWGQRLSDGSYATVYNPSEFRWPLAISLSGDGLEYKTLSLVHGEVPPMRYAGQYKSFGPQYVRGIQEGNGTPPDSALWVTYSVGKEDMWVARIPVPVRLAVTAHPDDDFAGASSIASLAEWNIYSPVLSPVSLEDTAGKRWLTLRDSDPFDFAKAERIIPATRELTAEFDLMAGQRKGGELQVEFVDSHGTPCSRLWITPDGEMLSKGGARYGTVLPEVEAGKCYRVRVELSIDNRNSIVYIDGKRRSTRMFFAPVHEISRIVFRTGARRDYPNPDTPADRTEDMPGADSRDPEALFRISGLKTSSADADAGSAILKYSSFARHAEYFNSMEDENIAQAIPNELSSWWMERNIPLFECPDADMEQMYYYRWWTLRKHIRETPEGYGMTEFLVQRSYADKYNLISCALGHHITESRWLRDSRYLDGILHTWYRGNDGAPMARMMNFSSWNPYAVYGRFLADGDSSAIRNLYPDLRAEYLRWEEKHRLASGLYWQRDVADGMEESISGARKQHHARPSINSYMYGNAKALALMAGMLGNKEDSLLFTAKADELRELVKNRLWNSEREFFETLRADTLARVREAIGFIPWYFNLPDSAKYGRAWLQIEDEKGFSAPYGLTTAERRHPEFRSHGVGRCEWDGAVWPFATSQTLTALANYLASDSNPTVSKSAFFRQMKLYVEASRHRGRPYIGEYLDEKTGYWLKGDQERSRYYNHSTFNDLVITGLVGLRPRADNTIELNPLVPENTWNWFCLDNIPYHGHNLTVLWDRDGTRYRQGKGLRVLVDGVCAGHADNLGHLRLPDALAPEKMKRGKDRTKE